MASTYLSRTQSASTTRTKFTFSCWVKISSTSGYRYIASSYASGDNRLGFYMHTNYGFTCYARIQGADQALRINLAQHRDVNGWYHFVVKGDSTQSSQADRIKLYTNGVEVTDFESNSLNSIGSSVNFAFGTTGHTFYIGNYDGTQYMYDGSMSHMHFCDGYAYDASAFGETDSTTGEWKINTSPNVSYGTNGFFLFKDDNAVTDRSGQGNNFTLGGGTLTKTEDCPSNVFATLNPLDRIQSNATYSNGNNTWTTTSGYYWARSTIGVSSGKYYFEAKLSSSPTHGHIGIVDDAPDSSTDSGFEDDAYNWGYKTSNGNVYNNGSNVSYGATYTTGDIIAVALDLDNNKLYFSKNGTWQNSGDPASGATGTGAISITDPSSTNTGNYFFAVGDNASATNGTWQTNFGNGYFGTTAVASAGTNASGIGIFEYDVPTGYTALSTKGLNE